MNARNAQRPPSRAVRTGARPRLRATVAVALALLASAGVSAQEVTLNLEGADIGALISTVSDITGKNFVVDPRVKGKVTVVSAHPMSKEEVYNVFLSILQVHGFTAIPSGEVVKVVPDANARQIGPDPPEAEGLVPAADAVTTRVIRLENVAAAQLVPLLRPLIPQEGHLAAYPATNVLIVSDRASNLYRLAEIIRRVDQASDTGVEVIRLRHAAAAEVVKVLTVLEQRPQQGEAPRPPAVLSADERTNSVLLSGDKPTRLRLRTLIAHLDTPIEATGNTHVVYLRYAKAKELASVLTGVAEQATGLAAPRPGTPGGAAAGGRTDVNIQADERSNALVITGQLDVVESIKGVIRQLDIRRAQVLVEAIIAEVSPSRAAELGIQWQTDLGISTGAFGRFSTPSGSRLGSINEGEKPVESLRGGLALGYLEGGSLRVLLRAIAEDKSSNVLSTPNLVTMDNEEAEIIVGQNVPFVTGQYTSAATTPDNPFQTIQRQDVGIILKVKPQINEGDAVRLDIKQEVSSVIPGTTGSNLSTNKRSIDTKVMVDDGQVLVLGGLIEDKLSENIAKVPLLGDVPVLGALFRSRQLTSDKINLMVFLKPTILRTPADGTLVSSAKYSLLRAQQQAYQPQGVEIIPRLKREVLPPWPGDSTGAVPPESAAPAPEPEPTEASHEPFRFPWEDS